MKYVSTLQLHSWQAHSSLKRTKESCGVTGVSPATIRVRPPPKKVTQRQLTLLQVSCLMPVSVSVNMWVDLVEEVWHVRRCTNKFTINHLQALHHLFMNA